MFEPEERRIVRRLKDFIKNEKPLVAADRIMLRNGRILYIDDYYDMVSRDKINPRDAYVYIGINPISFKSGFHYPFLDWYGKLLNAYLSKLGFRSFKYGIATATGLKYVAIASIDFYTGRYLSIELVNLDTAANNTNLPKIVSEVLGGKIISGEKELTDEEYEKIYSMFISQKLFAGRNVREAWNIVDNYYDEGNQSFAKEVARIAMDYDKIFQPYTVCYDMKTWDEIDCMSIKF